MSWIPPAGPPPGPAAVETAPEAPVDAPPAPLRPAAPAPRHRTAAAALALAVVVAVAAIAGGFAYRSARIDVSAVRPTAPVTGASRLGAGTPAPGLVTVAQSVMSRTVTVETLRDGAEELGTAWLLDNRGDFVTNAHVLEGRLAVRLRDRRGGSHQAVILGVDRARDVALIRSADGFDGPPLPVTDVAEPSLPEQVIAVASSRATGHADLTEETLTALHQSVPVQGDLQAGQQPTTETYTDMMELHGALIYPGDSGGPLLDSTGDVIGIVTLGNRTQPVAFAIPIGTVIAELHAWAAR